MHLNYNLLENGLFNTQYKKQDFNIGFKEDFSIICVKTKSPLITAIYLMISK